MAPHPHAIEAVARTGHQRYLDLCDPGHPEYDPRYLAVVASIIGATPDEPPVLTRPSITRVVSPSPDGRVRAALFCGQLYLGGAEAWQASILRHTDRSRIDWRGVGVVHPRCGASELMAKAIEAMAPIVWGDDAMAELAGQCDLILSWGLNGIPHLNGITPRPVHVAVSHGSIESTWTMDLFRRPVGIDHFAAVHEQAMAPVPKPYQPTVIYNAVDPDRLTPKRSRDEMRRLWGVPDGANVLGYLGRMHSETKNPAVVARAASLLPEGWHVVMVGEGPERETLASLDLPNLHLVGGDRSIGSVLGAFDTLCVPSDYESFCLSLCEGLWFGLPVISTRVGVCKNEPGLTRELAAITPEAVAKALRADLSDPAGTAARVVRSKAWAHDRVNPARFGREWTDYLCSVAPTCKTVVSRPVCSYREACGCAMPQCLHAERGPAYGRAEGQAMADGSTGLVYRVSETACVACGGVDSGALSAPAH